MAQRISRAKQTIKDSGIPFQLLSLEERAQRLRSVLHVLYLIFSEGYTSSAGDSLRRDDLSLDLPDRRAPDSPVGDHALQGDDRHDPLAVCGARGPVSGVTQEFLT